MSSRRDFLATSSRLAAGVALGAHRLPASAWRSTQPPAALLPSMLSGRDLQTLADCAIDAARAAGAAYADVRVGDFHWLWLGLTAGEVDPGITLFDTFTYGIRVMVDGAWAFVYGNVPTADAVNASVQHAVSRARAYAKTVVHRVDLAPAPAAQGEWTTPCRIDPFSVPLREQIDLMGAYNAAVTRVLGASTRTVFGWTKETRAFASTEGARVVQTIYRSSPDIGGGSGDGRTGATVRLPRITSTTGGYETILFPDAQDQLKAAAEEAVRLIALPLRTVDVGRYPIVCDGYTVGGLFGNTLGRALEMDRVTGREVGASGTSFLAPAHEVLGVPLFSPLLHVTADRALPGLDSIKWDDDGVETHPFSLINTGRIVDYLTSRDTASPLEAWYQRQGEPLQSRGCARAVDSAGTVIIRPPNMRVAPTSSTSTIDDLCKDIRRGFLLRNGDFVSSDLQLRSGALSYPLQLFEIERGKVVRRVRNAGIQFATVPLWKGIAAIGDSSTVCHARVGESKGMPWRYTEHTVSAPGVCFKEVNVMSTGAQ